MIFPLPIAEPSTNHQLVASDVAFVDAPARSCTLCCVSPVTINSAPSAGETIERNGSGTHRASNGRDTLFVGQASSIGSSVATSERATGAAASAPMSAPAPRPVTLPIQTTTVKRCVTAAHQASRCPLLVPVFQATLERDASGQIRAVRSTFAIASSAAKHASGRIIGVVGDVWFAACGADRETELT